MKEKKHTKPLSKRSGFTLIEIILVVVIIGILASIAIPRMGGRAEQANVTKAKADISVLSSAIQEYEIMNGVYPSSLDQLLDKSKGGPYLDKPVIPKDPWDKPYSYQIPGAHRSTSFDLSCTSPKGTVVNNWE